LAGRVDRARIGVAEPLAFQCRLERFQSGLDFTSAVAIELHDENRAGIAFYPADLS
jgi:hypothetical protein